MLIPFGTDRTLKRPTVMTYWLIGVNVIVFAAGAILERSSPETFARWYDALALDPNRFRAWGLITYQFMHGGFMHLVGNMVFLWVFGANIEDKLGRWWSLLFYLVGGAAAGGAHCLFETPIYEFEGVRVLPGVVGASGAIAAVTGAYMVLFPRTMVRVVCFIVFVGTFHLPAWWLIVGAIVKDVFFHGLGADRGVALVAHLGGYSFGIVVAFALLAFRVLPREDYDLFTVVRQARRRREFKELTSAGSSPWRADAGAKREAASPPSVAMELRGEVSRLVAERRLEEAARSYLRLLEEGGSAVMSRDVQATLGHYFYSNQQWAHAAVTYEQFARRYPADREAAGIQLLLAVICGRYLNDPVRAKAILKELEGASLGAEHRSLADDLGRELG